MTFLPKDEFDINERDPKGIGGHVDVSYNMVFAETKIQSLGIVWKLNYYIYVATRVFFYNLLGVLLVIPLAFMWGITFASLAFTYTWILNPIARLTLISLHICKMVIIAVYDVTVSPLFYSMGLMLSRMNLRLGHDEGDNFKLSFETV